MPHGAFCAKTLIIQLHRSLFSTDTKLDQLTSKLVILPRLTLTSCTQKAISIEIVRINRLLNKIYTAMIRFNFFIHNCFKRLGKNGSRMHRHFGNYIFMVYHG